MKKTTLLFLALFLILFRWTALAQEYVKLGVTSGFNADVIANGVGPAMSSTSERVDSGEFNFISKDFKLSETSTPLTVGLPVDRLITATNIPALSFLLASYNQNNSLRITAANTPSTLAFTNQESAVKMYLLTTAGNAGSTPVTFSAKINFTDNSFQTVTGLTVADWYQGTTATTVIAGIGRIRTANNTVETPAGNPKLFSVEINLIAANYQKQIANVEITKTSTATGVLNVFAVTVVKTPACFVPNTVSVDAVLATSATIKWLAAEIVPAMGYDYEVRTSGLPGSGATGLAASGNVANTILLKNVTGLAGSTEYFVYVRSKCSATSFSAWTVQKKFSTLCVFPTIVTTASPVCGQGTATLSATVPSGTVKWYDRAVGGSVLGIENSLLTPILQATKSYWVSSIGTNAVQGQGGNITPATSAGYTASNNYGVVVNVAQDVTLESVDVYSDGNGTLDVKITNAEGVELFSTGNINIVNGGAAAANVIPLGFDVSAGSTYKILIKAYSGVRLLRDGSNLAFPYLDPEGVITVPISEWGGTTSSFYFYFYNIKYSKGCVSPRQEVVATVTPAPAFNLSASAVSVCGGTPSTAVTITTGREAYESFVWTPATGVTGNAQNGWVFNPTVSTQYTLIASQNAGQRCQVAKIVDVKVRPTPTPTYVPATDAAPVCVSSIVALEVNNTTEKTAQVGDAVPTSFSNELSAFNNYRISARVQMLFTARELNDFGLEAGQIKSIAFNVATLGSSANNTNYKVNMATTNLTAFASASFITENITPVYSAATHTHTASGWQEIVFNTPYNWDGLGNLIVELDYSGTNSSASANTHHTVTTDNSVIFGYNGANISLSKNRFNIKFTQNLNTIVNWEAAGDGLYIDAAAVTPYLANGNVRRIYYRPQQTGLNEVTAIATVSGCSVTKVFNVNTFTVSEPLVEEGLSFCGEASVSDLVATGENLKWYDVALGGTPLAATTVLRAGDYYVSQTVDGCESLKKRFRVSFLNQPSPPVSPSVSVCGPTYLNDLQVQFDTANTLHWYDEGDNLITSNVLLRTGVYYVSQSNAACESARVAVNINANPVPVVPTATPLIICGQARVSDLNAQLLPGASARWYTAANSEVPMNSNEPLSTRTYYLSQVLQGCESDRTAVSVSVYAAVPVPLVQNQNFCTTGMRVSNLEAIALPGATIKWYAGANTSEVLPQNQILTSGLYYVSQKIGDCESPRVRIGVNIIDNTVAPNIVSQQFCGGAIVSQLRANVPTGMIVKWYTQETGGVALLNNAQLQSGWYYASQSLSGCESPRKRVEVIINEIPQQPTGEAIQEFDSGSVVGDLRLNVPNVIWFASAINAQDNRDRLFSDIVLIDDMVYYGVVISDGGCLSAPFAVRVKIKLSTNNFDLKQLNYYPNPVKDVLNITYNEVITKVEVFAITGQQLMVLHTADSEVNVDMSALANATYIVKMYTKTKVQSIKVIKK
ncbi:T9SS type A sorting domain-containing protein [Flavobacterium sp. NKUCC04_CG]|uniref:Ig-like domain-containing protein n=1 Tax=Flavobacterium sp. NKUCC04_CG TaxID=2842121 RepID=UPI001C5B401D|nr:T9SS type A sorting domain-containing protein [Flavobacterium sp. NKUCC04_CG]MBW3517697.1 T9SS type A sorting domain-containing protein [Flavobacterium sp. NKUCC04_CG]